MAATPTQIQDCWNKSVRAFGTADIFTHRLKTARRKLKLLTFAGLALPLSVGGVVVAFFGIEQLKPHLAALIVLSGVLSTLQAIISVWALVSRWDDDAVFNAEATSENSEISRQFRRLADDPPTDFDIPYQILTTKDAIRSQQDIKKNVAEWEKRKGMRVALREFQRQCVGCGQVPLDLSSTDCSVCGKFSFKYKYLGGK